MGERKGWVGGEGRGEERRGEERRERERVRIKIFKVVRTSGGS